MTIYHYINEVDFNVNRAIAVGGFDGIHLGHQKLIDVLFTQAKINSLKTLIVTFDPLPKTFFNNVGATKTNYCPPSILTTTKEKIDILAKKNIDELLIIKFNEEFSKLSPYAFLELLLDKIGFKVYVMGENHTFGHNRKGNIDFLKEKYNNKFNIIKVSHHTKNDNIVSTTLIKKLLTTENIEYINNFLSYNYFFISKVISGNKIGRKLGFPTANIMIPINKIVPKNGVYLVQIELCNIINEKKYWGIANIGTRPTIENFDNTEQHLEVHIFDFSEDIYDVEVRISFLKYIRAEQKFNNTNELAEQISKDIHLCNLLIKEKTGNI